MKLVHIFGDGAVGKMTVGQELAKITELKLFHNHMTIEPVIELLGQYNGKVTSDLRDIYFNAFAETDQYGMIFTFMWAFNIPSEWEALAKVNEIFERKGAQIYYVELVATDEARYQRNATENRLTHKASKRDTEASNQRMKQMSEKYRCVSHDGEITFENYIKIDNTHLAPEVVAQQIKETFEL